MALAASSFVDISTKPKPRGRPVNWSVTMRTDSTAPDCWNSSRRSSSVAWNDRLPTNSLAGIANLLPHLEPRASPPQAHRRGVGHNAPDTESIGALCYMPRKGGPYPTFGFWACQGNPYGGKDPISRS